jgi:predicted pPIWI-associating nuclease
VGHRLAPMPQPPTPEEKPKPAKEVPQATSSRRISLSSLNEELAGIADRWSDHSAAFAGNFMPQVSSQVLQGFVNGREELGRLVSNTIGTGLLDAVVRSQDLAASRLFSVSEIVSRNAFGDSMLTSNLAALAAQDCVAGWAKALESADTVLSELNATRLADLGQLTAFVTRQNALLMELHPIRQIALPVTLATRGFENVLRLSEFDVEGQHLNRIDLAGRVTCWTVNAGVMLTARTLDGEIDVETGTTLGPAHATAELRARLKVVDAELCVKLDGAWERINKGGTDAGRQAAHSLMEAVDWTLRTLAPEEDVMVWRRANDPKEGDLDKNGRPTRVMKLRYIVRDKPEKLPAMNLYRRAIGDLVEAIQSPKHGLRTTDPKALAPVALSVESFLLFLVGD